MEEILKFDTVSQYNAFNRNETLHPLVSVVDLSKAAPRQLRKMSYGFYVVFLKEIKCGDLKYGISNDNCYCRAFGNNFNILVNVLR